MWAVAEPFGVGVVVGLLGLVTLLPTLHPCAAMDVGWSEKCDAAVAVLLVVPGHIGIDLGPCGVDIGERAGIVRSVFHCAEL